MSKTHFPFLSRLRSSDGGAAFNNDILQQEKETLLKEVSELKTLIEDLTQKVLSLKSKEEKLLRSCSKIRASMAPSTRIKKKHTKEGSVLLGKELGKGALAKVYEAHVDGWSCACKVLTLASTTDYNISLFEQEMTLHSLLPSHPNIVKYLFHTSSKKSLNLYIEKYSGTLRSELSSLKKDGLFLPPKKADFFALSIAKGLSFLHQNSFIHRDLKSENIFVQHDASGEVSKVAIGDFDQCVQIGLSAQQPTEVTGTSGFIAPEVLSASAANPYSFQSDIFSLGMVFFEIANVDLPFLELPALKVANAVLDGKKPVWKDDAASAFPSLKHACTLCIKHSPEERPGIEAVCSLLKEKTSEPPLVLFSSHQRRIKKKGGSFGRFNLKQINREDSSQMPRQRSNSDLRSATFPLWKEKSGDIFRQ